MREAIQNAIVRSFQSMLDTRVEPLSPVLVLHINRNSIVQDTIDQVGDFSQKKFQYLFFFLSVR